MSGARRPAPSRLAWSLWATCVALTLVGLAFLVLNGGTHHANSIGSSTVDAVLSVLLLAYPTVGAAIAARDPGNAIGWLFLGAGLGASLEDALMGYAARALAVDPGSLPGGEVAALFADALWLPALGAASLLLFVLFPTGRPLSPPWRWFVGLVGGVLATYGLTVLVAPDPLYYFPRRDNPWGIEGTGAALSVLTNVTSGAIIISLLPGIMALSIRFRRARGIERLQLKWLFYAAALWTVSTPGLIVLGASSDGFVRVGGVLVGDVIFVLLLTTVPIAVGTAILRHRLYDIDVVINRTLVYGAVTLTLAATYLGSVLLFRLALSPFTGDSDLAVAASTLGVAALFRPVRSRIQTAVDRRFYRSRYDAGRTLERFSGRLRDELDLETLGIDLRTVVRETVQPAHVSLWLREATR